MTFVPAVKRQAANGALKRRITALLEGGGLECHACVDLDPGRSRMMICGNPEMIDETRKRFVDSGYSISRRAKTGWLAMETLW